ncbi:mechanosensitive ion channel family protein [Nigerium massiliense]|uniref:mechanosensitive ion channel family protein n=1 Tax=Nigerium massiliense TaxID=1522317 RepID=UPI000907D56B|nr:mechanosensitive ion channel family protein [Nigerium massiliense]
MTLLIPLVTWEWPATPLLILLTIVLSFVLRWFLGRTINAAVDAAVQRSEQRDQGQGERADRVLGASKVAAHRRHNARALTLGSVLRSAVAIAITIVAVLIVLDLLGFPMGPILTSAGIGGAALAFGAQSLVKDYLSGIFMLLEDQYGVGDLVDIGDVTGTVEDIGLRITRVRDVSGQVWYFRNGDITKLGNKSQGYSTGTIDVPVAYNEDASRVIDVLNDEMDKVEDDPRWANVLLERPDVAGVNAVEGGTMTIRIFAKCAPNQHWGVQRDILERSVVALRRAGIRGPLLAGTVHAPEPRDAGQTRRDDADDTLREE